MLNKRLLIILIVFITLATVATIGGTVFVVRGINIRFTNTLEYLAADEPQIIHNLEQELNFARGRSTIFSVNRGRIRRTIEEHEPRIIVTNIEVLPTRIEIRVRERYPVFEFQHGGQRIVMDRHLRFVTRSQITTRSLIDITGQIAPPPASRIEIGDYLDHLFYGVETLEAEGYIARMNRLRLTAAIFWDGDTLEDALTHLFNAITFTSTQITPDPGGRFDMVLSIRRLYAPFGFSGTSLHLMGVEDDNVFREMLRFTWDVRTAYYHMPIGVFRAYAENGCILVVTPAPNNTRHRCCDNP